MHGSENIRYAGHTDTQNIYYYVLLFLQDRAEHIRCAGHTNTQILYNCDLLVCGVPTAY